MSQHNRRFLILGLATLTAFFVLPLQSALACFCIFSDLPERWQESEAVFSGRVSEITQVNLFFFQSRFPFVEAVPEDRVSFEVNEVWKGRLSTNLSVYTPSTSGMCGFPFQIGKNYLVYASDYRGRLSASSCSGTQVYARATEDLAFLSSIPLQKVTAPPSRSHRSEIALLGVIIFGGLAALYLTQWKRRKSR